MLSVNFVFVKIFVTTLEFNLLGNSHMVQM